MSTAASARETSGPAVSAQPGPFLGAALNTATFKAKEFDRTQSGAGVALSAGYQFSHRFAVIGATSGARIDDPLGESYTLGHLDLLGRYSFLRPGGRATPHASAGVTRRTARFIDPAEPDGPTTRRDSTAATVGLGLDYRLTPSISLAASLNYTGGSISGNSCPSGTEQVRSCADSTRLALGVNWHPRRR